METFQIETDGAVLTYDVRGPLPTADGRPPLMMIGQPMCADGFTTLAGHFADRTVVTYDVRGLGRSTRSDGSLAHDPVRAAEDVHAVIEAVGGPVDLFGSSGGAVNGLALVAAHPDDVVTLVAHEPPLIGLLPDAERATAAQRVVTERYHAEGWGAGMAQFIAFTSWQGPFDDEYAAEPPPDPAAYGMPTDDDGSRDNPLLSGVSDPVVAYQPDRAAIEKASTRVLLAAGVETGEMVTKRTAQAAAELLGVPLEMFPSDHAGFLGGEYGQAGKPEEFAARLREVLGR